MPESRDRHHEVLLSIHADQRRAHFERDPELLFRNAAEQWTYVRNGQVDRLTRAELVERFRASLNATEHHEWDDIEPPIIEVSEDGTLAVMVEHVSIRLSRTAEDGSREELQGVYAGATVYRWDAEGWRSTINITTFNR